MPFTVRFFWRITSLEGTEEPVRGTRRTNCSTFPGLVFVAGENHEVAAVDGAIEREGLVVLVHETDAD